MWKTRSSKARQNKTMYLLLAAHPHGAALQELTQAGQPVQATPEPRLVSTGDLPAVVRHFESLRPGGQPPRWIWHRTQDWYPALLASGVELERCYDLSLCGNILAFSRFTEHTDYARNTERMVVEDPLQPPRSLQPPPPRQTRAPFSMLPGSGRKRTAALKSFVLNTLPSRWRWPRSARRITGGTGFSCCWRPSPQGP